MRGDGDGRDAYHARVLGRWVARLQLEDLALLAWMAFGWPILRAAFPDEFGFDSIFDPGHPVKGVLWTLAVAGAFAVIVSHDAVIPGQEPRKHVAVTQDAVESRFAMFGTLVGGMGLIGGGALAGLGLDPGLGFVLVFVGIPVLAVLHGLRVSPALPHEGRRWLLTPLLLIGSSIFAAFARTIGLGPDLLREALGQASSAGLGLTDTLAAVAGGLGLFVLAAAVYYAMLVAAPRQLIESEGGVGTWTIRFACFIVG